MSKQAVHNSIKNVYNRGGVRFMEIIIIIGFIGLILTGEIFKMGGK